MGTRRVLRLDLAPLAGQTPTGPGGDVLERPHYTNLDEIIEWEASLPG